MHSNGNEIPLSAERRGRILEMVNTRRAVTVPELVEAFPVSAITIRRDLDRLAEERLIERVHGGAMALSAIAIAPRASEKYHRLTDEQKRIGKEAANLVRDGDYVILESGSTCLAVIPNLAGKKDLRVLTVSPRIVAALSELVEEQAADIEIICSGGTLNVYKDFLMGPHARAFLESLNVDVALLSVTAIDLRAGVTADSLSEAEITQTIIEKCARRKIGLVVAGKFERTSFARVAPVESLDVIITSTGVDPGILEKYRERGIKITAV